VTLCQAPILQWRFDTLQQASACRHKSLLIFCHPHGDARASARAAKATDDRGRFDDESL
jgi:hypothetical protein